MSIKKMSKQQIIEGFFGNYGYWGELTPENIKTTNDGNTIRYEFCWDEVEFNFKDDKSFVTLISDETKTCELYKTETGFITMK